MSTDVQAQPPRLIWTKLHAPVRQEHVPRAGLLGELSAAPQRLVLVRAPAGWGKSALLSDWSASEADQRPFAWLGLDAGDNDATSRSQREIGEQLYVSLNTVKSHIKGIFRKLGVSARDEAVGRARELGLL